MNGTTLSTSFRIYSLSLEMQDIEAIVGPTQRRRPRESAALSAALARRGIRAVWFYESGLSKVDPVDRHIEVLVNFANENLDRLKQLEKECRFDICFGFSSFEHNIRLPSASFTIPHSILAKVPDLPIGMFAFISTVRAGD